MIALAAALALALGAAPDAAQVEALRARRAAEESAAKALAAQETAVLDALEEAQRALADAETTLRRLDGQRAGAEAELERARASEAAAARELDRTLAVLAPRLAARARMGSLGALRVLAASGSLPELARRRYLLDRILERDAALLREVRAVRSAREEARRAGEAAARRVAELIGAATAKRGEAEARREAQRALLKRVRGERSLRARAAAEAGRQLERLGALVAGLDGAGAARAGFAALRGRLPRPAEGPIDARFGRIVDPRFNTVTNHPGLDIGAPQGAPVRAVAPGRVVHAGWFRGYGNIVIVDHGDGYHSLVAHLGSMRTAVGEEVQAGTVLGTVGDTGSLKGPFLYFEIREKQRPIDPLPWLTP